MKEVGYRLEKACPECGADMVLKPSKYGLFYGCSTWPECNSTHSAHQATGEPMGIPADKETKAWRMKAHDAFDKLWKGKNKLVASRRQAYMAMQEMMEMSAEDAHISRFNVEQCKKLIDKVELFRNAGG